MIIDELIETWAEYDPVEGYAAGLESCKGKLFIPTPEAIEALRSRIEEVRKYIGTISDPDLQMAAGKILNCMNLDLPSPRPDRQVFSCAVGLFYILLKEDHKSDFVDIYIENAERLVRFEIARWAGTLFPITVRKACLDAAGFLDATLSALRNLKVGTRVGRVARQLVDYRELFAIEGINPDNFDELFPLMEQESAKATPTPKYERILSDCYDYDKTADQIRQQSLDMLAAELIEVRRLADHLVRTLKLPAGTLEEVYEEIGKLHPLGEDVLKKSQQVMSAVNNFTNEYIQEIRGAKIGVEIAPSYLAPLITSGATVVLNYLTPEPLAKIYITGERNASWLTLLNVMAHEATHAYQGLIAATSAQSKLVKLRSYLSTPSSEAMAFHREFEFYDLIAHETLGTSTPTAAKQEMLDLFGSSDSERAQRVEAFEMETRIWRLIRYLRAIFDVEVNSGMKSYVDFVNWANQETALSKKFIHQECFTFLTNPGYTPAYAICGRQYEEAQKQKMNEGVSRKSFNTQAQQIGYWPWTLYLKKLQAFNGQPTSS